MTRNEAMRQTRQLEVLQSLGFTQSEAESLRRISITLRRWHELECNGEVERDEQTGKVFAVNTYTGRKYATADRETGALKRLASIIERRNANLACGLLAEFGGKVSSYIQGDPRGAALYIIRPGDVPAGEDVGAYYSRGVCVY